MPSEVTIRNLNHPEGPIVRARYCNSFFCRLRGLMFQHNLPEGKGLLLVQNKESVISSSIHMLFMWMDLAIVWIDSTMHVIDIKRAKRWHLAYKPEKPARYVLEMTVKGLDIYCVGDMLAFETDVP